MTECNGCGDCCEVIPFPYRPEEVRYLWKHGQVDTPTARWAVEHLHPLTRRQVSELHPWRLRHAVRVGSPEAEPELWPRYYRCDLFDAETRRCTAYAERPPPCREYPWPDGVPNRNTLLSPHCSFRADVGQPVELRRG